MNDQPTTNNVVHTLQLNHLVQPHTRHTTTAIRRQASAVPQVTHLLRTTGATIRAITDEVTTHSHASRTLDVTPRVHMEAMNHIRRNPRHIIRHPHASGRCVSRERNNTLHCRPERWVRRRRGKLTRRLS